MTKAEKIFDSTYYECRVHIKNWGPQYNDNGDQIGFNGVITDESVSTRTLNAIQKLLDRERKTVERYESLGVAEAERIILLKNALGMVQATLDNSRKVLAR